MPNATKTTKTLTAATKGMLVLEPGVYFQRKTNLPANWLRCRVGLIVSMTNTVGLNSTPNAETIAFNSNLKMNWLIGLSNGLAFPGEATSRFVGFKQGTMSSNGPQIDFSSPNWRFRLSGDTSFYGVPLIADGTTLSAASGNLSAFSAEMGDPTASANSLMCIAIDLDCATSGVLKLSWLTGSNIRLSSATDANLAGFLTNGTFSSQISTTGTTGWWNGTSTFCGLQYLSFRCPFLTNRLRVLNMMCIQTA